MWGRRVYLVGSSSCSLACPVLQSATSLGLSASRHLARSPLHPGCLSAPLLPVWMNVSSLSPWSSGFHTVRFSVSSGCFLSLNCCSSFGCVRRHSVSTYASILAGSSTYFFFKRLVISLVRVAQWIGCWPANQRVAGLIPSLGTCLGGRPGPYRGLGRGNHTLMFLSLSPSLSPKINK